MGKGPVMSEDENKEPCSQLRPLHVQPGGYPGTCMALKFTPGESWEQLVAWLIPNPGA